MVTMTVSLLSADVAHDDLVVARGKAMLALLISVKEMRHWPIFAAF